jgi:hypothetical protein
MFSSSQPLSFTTKDIASTNTYRLSIMIVFINLSRQKLSRSNADEKFLYIMIGNKKLYNYVRYLFSQAD